MLVGVPREIKDNEFRVGMTPAVAAELIHHGHQVLVETSAGLGSGLTDDEYRAAGATIADKASDIFARAEMVVKVKEPQAAERKIPLTQIKSVEYGEARAVRHPDAVKEPAASRDSRIV